VKIQHLPIPVGSFDAFDRLYVAAPVIPRFQAFRGSGHLREDYALLCHRLSLVGHHELMPESKDWVWDLQIQRLPPKKEKWSKYV
jgi:hypothetical protein